MGKFFHFVKKKFKVTAKKVKKKKKGTRKSKLKHMLKQVKKRAHHFWKFLKKKYKKRKKAGKKAGTRKEMLQTSALPPRRCPVCRCSHYRRMQRKKAGKKKHFHGKLKSILARIKHMARKKFRKIKAFHKIKRKVALAKVKKFFHFVKKKFKVT